MTIMTRSTRIMRIKKVVVLMLCMYVVGLCEAQENNPNPEVNIGKENIKPSPQSSQTSNVSPASISTSSPPFQPPPPQTQPPIQPPTPPPTSKPPAETQPPQLPHPSQPPQEPPQPSQLPHEPPQPSQPPLEPPQPSQPPLEPPHPSQPPQEPPHPSQPPQEPPQPSQPPQEPPQPSQPPQEPPQPSQPPQEPPQPSQPPLEPPHPSQPPQEPPHPSQPPQEPPQPSQPPQEPPQPSQPPQEPPQPSQPPQEPPQPSQLPHEPPQPSQPPPVPSQPSQPPQEPPQSSLPPQEPPQSPQPSQQPSQVTLKPSLIPIPTLKPIPSVPMKRSLAPSLVPNVSTVVPTPHTSEVIVHGDVQTSSSEASMAPVSTTPPTLSDPSTADASTKKQQDSRSGLSEWNMVAIASAAVGLIVLSILFSHIRRKRQVDDDIDDFIDHRATRYTATVRRGANFTDRESSRMGDSMMSSFDYNDSNLDMMTPGSEVVRSEYSTTANDEASKKKGYNEILESLIESTSLHSPSELSSSLHSFVYDGEDIDDTQSVTYSEADSYMDQENDTKSTFSDFSPRSSLQSAHSDTKKADANTANEAPVVASSFSESCYSDLDDKFDDSYSYDDTSFRSQSEFSEYFGTNSEYSRPSDDGNSSRFDSRIQSSLYSESNRDSAFSDFSIDSYSTYRKSNEMDDAIGREFDV